VKSRTVPSVSLRTSCRDSPACGQGGVSEWGASVSPAERGAERPAPPGSRSNVENWRGGETRTLGDLDGRGPKSRARPRDFRYLSGTQGEGAECGRTSGAWDSRSMGEGPHPGSYSPGEETKSNAEVRGNGAVGAGNQSYDTFALTGTTCHLPSSSSVLLPCILHHFEPQESFPLNKLFNK
jgi:hypothetical protein